jgi:RNA polymerase sigma-70 factor (ECF subfamily)
VKEGALAQAGRARSQALDEAAGATTADVTDEALMLAYAGGDAGSFDALYDRHKGPLYRYFTRQLTESEANDCFQNLWEKLIDNRDRYRPEGSFRSYLFTIAHNVLMDHYRKLGRIGADPQTDPDELSSSVPGPETRRERSELIGILHGLIRRLPNHQREAWLLRQETTFSTAEIARVTGTSEEGVKSRLRYAREKLKQGMARYVE